MILECYFRFLFFAKNVIVGLLQKQDAVYRSASLISKIKHGRSFLTRWRERKNIILHECFVCF